MKLLKEHYLTCFSGDQNQQKYLDDVWDIFETSYASIGGTHSSKEELTMPGIFWKLVRRNGKIVAAVAYKEQNGRKAFLAGTDGSAQGKLDLKKIIHEDAVRDERNAWAEVSGAPEKIFTREGFVPIPNEQAKEILEKQGKKVLELDSDGYHYKRKIGGDVYRKLLVGKLKSD